MANTKRIIFCGAFAGLMVLLSGCASTPERSSPQSLKAEDRVRPHEQVGGASSSRKQLPELNDASGLKDYLAYAALNNPQLEAAFNRWKAALEMVSQARTLPDPRFNYGYFIQEVETRVGPQEQRVGLSQMFPWFGKLKLRSEAALGGANAMQQQYEVAKLRLFDEVKQAYYELYYVGRAVGVATENVDLLKQLEEIARSKYESGTAEHGDVIKAQVELDKLRDRLRTLQDFKHPLVARLNAALNRPAESALPFPTNHSPGVLPSDTAQLLEQLKSSNPELKSLDFQAEKDKAAIALARKEFYPDVTLGVDYVQTGEARMAGVSDSGKDPVMVGFSVNIPLWWSKYRAGVREAESRYAATQQDRQDRANRLSTDLQLALFKYQDAERKIALYRDALIPKADQNLKVIQRSFEAGKSDFLSLIDAERILLEFQLTYERAVADREQGLATVEKLAGGESSALAPANERKP
ncbi:MAG: TolC family protein [Verrucomicrobia bacterium]|nr:TolC family protein [Verrucomicrobiota bacterium]